MIFETSPNNRATCLVCKKLIKKGEVRIAIFECSRGFYNKKYIHFDCYLEHCPEIFNSLVEAILKIILPRIFGEDNEHVKELEREWRLNQIAKEFGRNDENVY
jgi:hypothetical protein